MRAYILVNVCHKCVKLPPRHKKITTLARFPALRVVTF